MDLTELRARYKMRAPRYTSYPTAPKFGPIEADVVDAAMGRNTGPMSLYFHIPFCSSLCWYCGCHTEIFKKKDVANPYVEALVKEIELVAARLAPGREVVQLSMGGGTPTFLTKDQMSTLWASLRKHFTFAEGADLSIEVDPRSVDGEALNHLWDLGLRRYSFGVQDFHPDVLNAVHRWQPVELTREAVEHVRKRAHAELGNDTPINFDLLYGLPNQDVDKFRATLDEVVKLRPSRIALFQYAHVPWMKPAQKLLERFPMPDTEMKAAMFSLAEEKLGEVGYVRLGMDHFALPGDPLLEAYQSSELGRNFQGYTTWGDIDLYGFGVSAISNFGGIYSQNTKERDSYREALLAGRLPIEKGLALSDEDQLRRTVIMRLMAQYRVGWREVACDEPAQHFAAELAKLQPMVDDGLLEIRADGLEVTEIGRDFVRNVCTAFDQYFEADPNQRRYSHTA